MSLLTIIKSHPLVSYYILTFIISWGGILLVINGFGGIPTTKEQFDTQLPFAIPAMLGGPSLAGILLTGIIYGKTGFRELLLRLMKWKVSVHWYAIVLLTAPLVLISTLLTLSFISPVFLPGILTTDNKVHFHLSGILGGTVVGIFEELGWTGFAVPRLRIRYSILTTGLIAGVLWGAWHIFSNDIWGGSTYSGSLSPAFFLIVNGILFLIGQLPAFRILMVWVYDRTESLLIVMLMHASLTASTLIFAPLRISGLSLLIYGIVSAFVMWIIVAVVTLINRRQLSQKIPPKMPV